MNSKKHYQKNSVSQIRELIDSGEATEALKSLQQMITSAPENAELYYLLGDAYYQKEKWNDACQAYLRAVNLQPNMAQALIGFGDASVELKAYVEADKAYKHALQQDPSVVKQLALCYKAMGDVLAADLQGKLSYKSYYNAFGLDDSLVPELQAAFAALSDTLRQAGQLEYAQQAQIQADRFAQELEALHLLQEGKAREALPLLQAAVAVETERAMLHYQIGEAYYQLREWKAACEAYLQALNLKPDMVEASLKFAVASIEQGAYAEAEKALAYALEKNPEIADRQVAQLYKRIGDGFAIESMGKKAREAYQKALALDATLSTDVLTSLLEVLGNGNSLEAGSAASSEENELLLLQLHQVQEELEQYFFRNQSLESKLQEAKKQEKIDKNIVTDLNQQFSKLSARLENLLRIEAYFATGKVMPALHGWAISPDLAFFIINLIESERYNLIIEFGSGSSTVIIANVLERLKRSSPNDKFVMRQVTFEHSKEYYKKTLGLLTQAGLSSDVQLVYSPLDDYKADNGCVYSYYDICHEVFSQLSESFLSRNARILVLIDGPPGSTGKHARYPALPIINQYFKYMNVDFLLDDYNRDEEKEIVEMWKNDLENASRKFYLEEYSFEKGACLIRLSS